MRTNLEVQTPLGAGVVQGRWSPTEYLVRVQITDANRKRLGLSLTPRAVRSGLWVFAEKELRHD